MVPLSPSSPLLLGGAALLLLLCLGERGTPGLLGHRRPPYRTPPVAWIPAAAPLVAPIGPHTHRRGSPHGPGIRAEWTAASPDLPEGFMAALPPCPRLSVEALARPFQANDTAGATDEDIAALEAAVSSRHGVRAKVPAELRALWRHAQEWHLIPDHYDVFGFNIPVPAALPILATSVFGGEEERRQWQQDATGDPPSSAAPGWVPFAATSEFDFLTVNLDADTTGPMGWGATRHVVNNCGTDRPLTSAPFCHFMGKLEALAAVCPSRGDFDDDDAFAEAMEEAVATIYRT